jgi:hypothetical protein
MPASRTTIRISKNAQRSLTPFVGMPPIFGPSRTEFIVMLAVNGPNTAKDIAAALGVDRTGPQRMLKDLIDMKVCILKARIRGTGWIRSLASLDRRHPAAKQIAEVALALDKHFPVPRISPPPGVFAKTDRSAKYAPEDVDITRLFHPLGRTEQVLLVAAAGEIERTAISTTLKLHHWASQKDTPRLEHIGLLRSRPAPNDHRRIMISLNPDFAVYKEFKRLVDRLLHCYPKYRLLAEEYRRRRMRGVPIRVTNSLTARRR